MKRIILLLTLWNVCFGLCMAQKQYQLKSPDGKLNINIEMGDKIYYSLFHEGDRILNPSPVSMLLGNGKTLGLNPEVKRIQKHEILSSTYKCNFLGADNKQ